MLTVYCARNAGLGNTLLPAPHIAGLARAADLASVVPLTQVAMGHALQDDCVRRARTPSARANGSNTRDPVVQLRVVLSALPRHLDTLHCRALQRRMRAPRAGMAWVDARAPNARGRALLGVGADLARTLRDAAAHAALGTLVAADRLK